MNLQSLRAFILDMDGVVYKGEQSIPGAVEFLAYLDAHQIPHQFLTNNSTRTPQQVAAGLLHMGISVSPERILTSSIGAALFLKKQRPDGARVFVLGEEGLRRPLTDAGFTLADDGPADFVVQGLDRKLTYDKLARATMLLRGGAQFIATNPDATYPSSTGLVPGAGAISAALTVATEVKPLVIGKPEPACFQLALERLGTTLEETATIGDRLDTDIAGGRRAGLASILVLTGVSSRAEAEAGPEKPEWIFEDLNALRMALSQHAAG